MLHQVVIENFYSIRERQVIDLVADSKVPEQQGRLVPIFEGSDERTPRVVALFGANASGKTNVLRAISFLAWFVQSSFDSPAEEPLLYQKFASKDAIDSSTFLSVSFAGPSDLTDTNSSSRCKYVYSLELAPRKGPTDRVQNERLQYRPFGERRLRRVFERLEDGSVKASPEFELGKDKAVLEKILRPDASVICTLEKLNHSFSAFLTKTARAIYSNVLLTRSDSFDRRLFYHYAEKPDVLQALNQEIRRLDLGIQEINIAARNGELTAEFRHQGLDAPVQIGLESHGTQQFFNLFPAIYQALATGSIAIIDELDAAIHPLVLPEILRWFGDNSRNARNAQLWISCHNASILDDLIKEEVLICEKNHEGETSVFGLSDIRGIRRQENFLKGYLGGNYGGVPNIG